MGPASGTALALILAMASVQGDSGELHPGFCAQLASALEWAGETPPFASHARPAQAEGRWAWTCVLSGLGDDRRLTCEWQAPPATDLWEKLNGAIRHCMPRAVRIDADGTLLTAHFRIGAFAIHTRHRNAGARDGSYVSYTVFRLPRHR